MTGISVWWTLYPPQAIQDWLDLLMPPFLEFRALILVLAAVGFLICYLVEHFLVDWLLIARRTNQRAAASGGGAGAKGRKFAAILGDVGGSPAWLRQILERKRRRASVSGSSTSADNEKVPFLAEDTTAI